MTLLARPLRESVLVSRRALIAAIGAMACGVAANAVADPIDEGDNSDEYRENALRSVPLRQMKAEARARIEPILESPSLYRKLPTQRFRCDKELHVFLVRHPEVVVNIWKLMGFTNITCKRTAPYVLDTNDGAGTIGRVELLYGTPEVHLFLCDGSYEGSLFKRKIVGRAVILVRSQYARDRQGNPVATDKMDVFVQIDNVGAEIVVKTLQTPVGLTVDANFTETCRFAGRIHKTADENGEGVQRMSEKLTDVEPKVRSEFGRISLGVHERAGGTRAIAQANGVRSIDDEDTSPTDLTMMSGETTKRQSSKPKR